MATRSPEVRCWHDWRCRPVIPINTAADHHKVRLAHHTNQGRRKMNDDAHLVPAPGAAGPAAPRRHEQRELVGIDGAQRLAATENWWGPRSPVRERSRLWPCHHLCAAPFAAKSPEATHDISAPASSRPRPCGLRRRHLKTQTPRSPSLAGNPGRPSPAQTPRPAAPEIAVFCPSGKR